MVRYWKNPVEYIGSIIKDEGKSTNSSVEQTNVEESCLR